MAINYYEGWSEIELLTERRMVQSSLATGRTTELRLAGELTRTDDKNAPPLELTLQRIAYSLYCLTKAGQTEERVYENPYSPAITPQFHV